MMISATTAARMISAIFDIPPSKGYGYAVAPTGPRGHRRGPSGFADTQTKYESKSLSSDSVGALWHTS